MKKTSKKKPSPTKERTTTKTARNSKKIRTEVDTGRTAARSKVKMKTIDITTAEEKRGDRTKDKNPVPKKKEQQPPLKDTPVESTAVSLKTLSKTNTKELRSIIGDSAEEIHQLLEVGENDSATTLLHKKLMQTLIDLVPFAEHTIRKSEGRYGVYQINALVSQVRELLVDIQSTQDRGQLGINLVESIIRPAFQDIGMQIVQEFDALSSDAKQRMSAEEWKGYRDALQTSRNRIGEVVNREYHKMRDECISFMQR